MNHIVKQKSKRENCSFENSQWSKPSRLLCIQFRWRKHLQWK